MAFVKQPYRHYHYSHHGSAATKPDRPASIWMTLVLTLTLTGVAVVVTVTGLPFPLGESSDSRAIRRSHVEATAREVSGRLGHLTDQLQAQGAQITDLASQIAKVTQSVSFTVTFSGRDLGDLKENQTLKFDKVFFNAGEGYSPSTGLFTAPADGLYAFNLQVSHHPMDPKRCAEINMVHTSILSHKKKPSTLRKTASSMLSKEHKVHIEASKPPPPPSDLSTSQEQQSFPNSNHHLKGRALQQNSSAPEDSMKEETVTSVSACRGDNTTKETTPSSSRAMVRLGRGDTMQARVRSPGTTRLLGDVFTSMSGLKLADFLRSAPVVHPLHHD